MCGICGVFNLAEHEPIDATGLESMKEAIVHRGPDQEGSYVETFLGLGHRRLSIIGVGDGRQPLSNEDGSVWTTFNGEIYNYRELRDRLAGQGHRFRTHTDTEVLVHLYEEEGPDMVEALRGMFAFAIWDRAGRKLFLARDRLGKKPLYYRKTPDALLFASEIKAILAYPGVSVSPSFEALHHYLSLAYVPAPHTAFEEISCLPAGHCAEVTRAGVTIRKYWDVDFTPRQAAFDELIDRLDAGFDEAVRIRLESEVPLGVFLSSGLDSAAVAHRMASHLDRPVVSTTIRFDDPRYDESCLARESSRSIGTDHREHTVVPGDVEVLEKIVRHFDEPFADNSALPTYFLCRAARNELTVALSGDGGDEMFAGYTRYRQFQHEERLRRLVPAPLRRVFAPLLRLPRYRRGSTFLENLGLSSRDAALNTFFTFTDGDKRSLYSDDFSHYLAERFRTGGLLGRYFDSCSSPEELSKLLYTDYRSYLVDDILVKVDRMSMAHSLEVRSPLLDHELVELVASFPASTKLCGGFRNARPKHIFKEMLARHLPAEILTRPKKGFSVPLSAWFRGELREFVKEIVLGDSLARRGYFDRACLERLWRLQERDDRTIVDLGQHFWVLVMLELWHRQYVDTPCAVRAS